jgi:hypothetical protein
MVAVVDSPIPPTISSSKLLGLSVVVDELGTGELVRSKRTTLHDMQLAFTTKEI